MRNLKLASIFATAWLSLIAIPSTSALAAGSASFVKVDTSTVGNWIGHYGADGYNVSQDATVKTPAYAQINLSGASNYVWSASPSGTAALQRPENPSGRIASTWYGANSFFIDVNLTDGNTHQIALYNLDFDWSIRSQTINVRDASTNAILDSRTLAAGATFHNGEYLVWNVQGHVKYEIIRTGAFNAVISGIFFDTQTGSSTRSLSIPTYHATLANDGQNLKETILTPTNVSSASFGKIVSVPLSGDVYTQPLFQSGVTIPGKGTHDTVFTVTSNGVAYAIDAYSGAVLWTSSLVPPGATAVLDVYSTPVLSTLTNAMYVLVHGYSGSVSIYALFALNLADGTPYAAPAVIGKISGWTTYISGPSIASGRMFNGNLLSRNLVLNPVNNVVYASFAAGGDLGPYNGWIVGYNSVKNGSGNLDLAAVWCSTPNGNSGGYAGGGNGAGGIWMSGGGIAVDSFGDMYLATGNGSFEQTLATVPYNGRLTTNIPNLKAPSGMDFGDSVIKLRPDSDVDQSHGDNPNGWGLHVADYFTPADQSYRQGPKDLDVGSSSPVLLPPEVGSTAHPNLLVMSSKEGEIWLIDRNNMGGFSSIADNVVQKVTGQIQGMWSTPAYYSLSNPSPVMYYIADAYGAATGDFAKAFSINNGRMSGIPVSVGTYRFSKPGSTPQISANGASNGLVWALDPGANVLLALNAGSLAMMFFNSGTGANALPSAFPHAFLTPMVAAGHVYVGTKGYLTIYGLH